MNVELHGWESGLAERVKREFRAQLPKFASTRTDKETVITINHNLSENHIGRASPFARVYSDHTLDFKIAAKVFSEVRRILPKLFMTNVPFVIEPVRLESCLQV